MSAKIYCYVITVIIAISCIVLCDAALITKYDVQPNPDVILKCRQKCFSKVLDDFKFNGKLMQFLRCKDTPNCYMCWDYCRAISVAKVDLARSMCSDKQFCTKGCKVACRFHRIQTIYDLIDMMS